MKKTKLLAIALCAALFTTVFAGCGKQGENEDGGSQEKVVIDFSMLNLSGDASATAGNLYKIHGNFSNVFYLDGHAESIQEADLNKRYYPKVSGEGAEKVAAGYKFLTE